MNIKSCDLYPCGFCVVIRIACWLGYAAQMPPPLRWEAPRNGVTTETNFGQAKIAKSTMTVLARNGRVDIVWIIKPFPATVASNS